MSPILHLVPAAPAPGPPPTSRFPSYDYTPSNLFSSRTIRMHILALILCHPDMGYTCFFPCIVAFTFAVHNS